MNHRDEILSKVLTVPSLPTVVIEVMQQLQDSDVNTGKITRTIEYDPSLTSNILRLANSAYFGYSRKIASIREAIVRLGTDKIYRLIIGSIAASKTQAAIKGYDLSPGKLWEHSVAVAIGTDKLTSILNLEVPEHTFTTALLHDIGKIVLGTFVEVDITSILQRAYDDRISFEIAEREVLGIDHTEVGAALLESWNLPQEIVEVVKYHHQPDQLGKNSMVVDLVHISDILCMMSGTGAGIDGLNYQPSPEVVKRLKLTKNINETVVFQTMESLDEVRNIFTV